MSTWANYETDLLECGRRVADCHDMTYWIGDQSWWELVMLGAEWFERLHPAEVAPTEVFIFDLSDAWSKWGFGDGDMLNDVIDDILVTDLDLDWPVFDHEAFRLHPHQEVLFKCVERLVAGRTELMRIGSCHNPVRAQSHWEGTDETPLYDVLTMTRDEIIEIVKEVHFWRRAHADLKVW